MKKIILPLILLMFIFVPIGYKAENLCTNEQINEYQKQLENIKIDVKHDKNIMISNGDIDGLNIKRTKGIYSITINNIPDNYSVYVGNGIIYNYFTKNNNNFTGYCGGIYDVIYKNVNCEDSELGKFSFYLPTYSANANGSVWNDGTIYIPNYEKGSITRTVLLFILFLMIIIALVFTILFIKNNRVGKEWTKS